nr:putative ribonuclease H-like domain-containing protein [Tanacetum cinerariifolium]
MLIFSRAPLFLWAEAIATACYTQNCSIIRRRFDKTPYKLINGRKPYFSFLHVFGAFCYPENDREDIRKLGAKRDIGFFIGYSANSCSYRVYNRRTKNIMETLNVTFDELSAMSHVIIIRTDNGTEFKNHVLKEYFDTVGISYQMSSVRTPQQNRVVERRNQTLAEAARTMLIFSHAPLFLWAEAIATACFTQNRSIIHHHFNKTPYELINGRKPDISFLHNFQPKDKENNGDHECLIDELLAMVFEQRSSKPGLQSMTSGQISSRLDLTYAPSTITTQQPSEGELNLLFEAMYDDYIGGKLLPTARTVLAVQEPQVHQTSMASTSIADTAPAPTNSFSHATNIPITS